MPFRFQGFRAFLTYAQCPIEHNDLLALLRICVEPAVIVEYAIGQETHEDGNLHLHAYLQFDRRVRGNEQLFDVLSNEGVRYHPNIQTPRSPTKVIDYVTKDGNFIKSDGVALGKRGWGDIVDAPTKEDFFAQGTRPTNQIDPPITNLVCSLWYSQDLLSS